MNQASIAKMHVFNWTIEQHALSKEEKWIDYNQE